MLSPREWALIVFMGIVQFGLPYYFYTLGLARVPAYQAAILTMAEPVLVPVWTFLAVGEKPPLMTLIGGVIIFVALLLFLRTSTRSPR
jgi:drug/metabolite transporter (DMT)-like permease